MIVKNAAMRQGNNLRINMTEQVIPNYLTVKQFHEKHTAFTRGGIRDMIFKKEKNGLHEAGAIIKNGRRVLIDEAKFFHWVANRQG